MQMQWLVPAYVVPAYVVPAYEFHSPLSVRFIGKESARPVVPTPTPQKPGENIPVQQQEHQPCEKYATKL